MRNYTYRGSVGVYQQGNNWEQTVALYRSLNMHVSKPCVCDLLKTLEPQCSLFFSYYNLNILL